MPPEHIQTLATAIRTFGGAKVFVHGDLRFVFLIFSWPSLDSVLFLGLPRFVSSFRSLVWRQGDCLELLFCENALSPLRSVHEILTSSSCGVPAAIEKVLCNPPSLGRVRFDVRGTGIPARTSDLGFTR